ncbi:unnamed protein product [Rotaria sordida]|uniref:MULE transposase domain-containing protein n=1 Tax=Rotaria sordida TaxID=392033 RepID=A0A819ZYG4_9BILA|nr:unnamed protein product [Rotaria sordida]
MLQFTTSERNKPVLNYNRNQYTLKRIGATTNEWRYHQRKCSSSLSLTSNNTIVFRTPSAHSCEKQYASKQIIDEAIQRMKKHAREETTTIPKIYTEELIRTRLENPSMVTGISYPDLRSVDSSLYRQRALNFHRLPNDLYNFKIPYEWTLGLRAEPFLLIDEFYGNNNQERMLIFATDWSLSFLSACSRWHSDGTFNVTPLRFEQVYVVCGFSEGFMIPCVYALTTRKDQITYSKLFHHIITLGENRQGVRMRPTNLTCDFEQSAINAIKLAFPGAHVKTCFFHFCQSLWRKIVDCSLSKYFIHPDDNDITDQERKNASYWFNGAIG